MKMMTIILLVALLMIGLVRAETSINFLSKGFADTLYCPIADGCGGSDSLNVTYTMLNITENLTVQQNLSVHNNADVDGDLSISGDVCIGCKETQMRRFDVQNGEMMIHNGSTDPRYKSFMQIDYGRAGNPMPSYVLFGIGTDNQWQESPAGLYTGGFYSFVRPNYTMSTPGIRAQIGVFGGIDGKLDLTHTAAYYQGRGLNYDVYNKRNVTAGTTDLVGAYITADPITHGYNHYGTAKSTGIHLENDLRGGYFGTLEHYGIKITTYAPTGTGNPNSLDGAASSESYALWVDAAEDAGLDEDWGIWVDSGDSYFHENVGIGDSSPAVPLEVSDDGTDSATFSGRVCIGGTNPTHELNVIGDVNVTGDLYVNYSSVFIGDEALSNDEGVLKWNGTILATGNVVWNGTGGEINTTHNVTIDANLTVTDRTYLNGMVGIGTPPTTHKLHVKGGNTNNMMVDNSGEQYTQFNIGNAGTTKAFWYWDNTNEYSFLNTNSMMRLGIGGGTKALYTATRFHMTQNLTVEGNITGNQIYGEKYQETQGLLNLVDSASWLNITGFDNGSINGFEQTGYGLKAKVDGLYKIDYTGSGEIADVESTFQTIIEVEGTIHNNTYSRVDLGLTGASLFGSTGLVQVSAGDKVNLLYKLDGDPQGVDIYGFTLTLWRVGE